MDLSVCVLYSPYWLKYLSLTTWNSASENWKKSILPILSVPHLKLQLATRLIPAFHLIQNRSPSTLLPYACILLEVIFCWCVGKPWPWWVHFSSGYILRATELLYAHISLLSPPLSYCSFCLLFICFFLSAPHLFLNPLAFDGATVCVNPLRPLCTAAW